METTEKVAKTSENLTENLPAEAWVEIFSKLFVVDPNQSIESNLKKFLQERASVVRSSKMFQELVSDQFLAKKISEMLLQRFPFNDILKALVKLLKSKTSFTESKNIVNNDFFIELIFKKVNGSSKNDSLFNAVVYDAPLSFIKKLISEGANVNYNPGEGSVLHEATAWNGEEGVALVRLLLASGADINSRDLFTRSTPLIDACYQQNDRVVKELINKGASLNLQDSDGNTALIVAFIGEDEDENIVRKIALDLINAGANLNIKNRAGSTALDFTEDNYESVATLLRNHGALRGNEF